MYLRSIVVICTCRSLTTLLFFLCKGSSPATFETPEHGKEKDTSKEHKDTGQPDKDKTKNGKYTIVVSDSVKPSGFKPL